MIGTQPLKVGADRSRVGDCEVAVGERRYPARRTELTPIRWRVVRNHGHHRDDFMGQVLRERDDDDFAGMNGDRYAIDLQHDRLLLRVVEPGG